MLLLALWTGKNGTWVWGRELKREQSERDIERTELRSDRDYYRNALFDVLHRADRTLDVADRAVQAAAEQRGRS